MIAATRKGMPFFSSYFLPVEFLDPAHERAQDVGLEDFSLFCLTIAMRSRPRPVSMEGFGSGGEFAGLVAVVLHEDEIPEFEIPRRVFRERLVRIVGAVLFSAVN